MYDRCAFVYKEFLTLPPEIHMIVDSYGGIWDFVTSSHVTAENANIVGSFLGEVLEKAEQWPQVQTVAASMLSLLAKSEWAQMNREVLWWQMSRIFARMPPWSPVRGELCLAMCYFGCSDDDHGVRMRDLLAGLDDAQELIKLTLYISGKVSTQMADAILGYN